MEFAPTLIRRYSNLIALPHTVFALPFALASFLMARAVNAAEGRVLAVGAGVQTLLLVALCVLSARTAAMAFNRYVDRRIDAANPRTVNRELPRGALAPGQVLGLVILSSAAFLLFAALLGRHCLILAPFVLGALFFYSLTKRFTQSAHLFLGFALALGPGGAWWVLRPQVELAPIILMIGVLFWVAGFDVLYSCQDIEFDRKHNLHSIPAAVGLERALLIAKIFHAVSFCALISVGLLLGLTARYYLPAVLLGTLFLGQHLLISARDLRLLNQAFFTMNGMISIGYLAIVVYSLH